MFALYRVLHARVQPVEQYSVLVDRMVVEIVQVHWELDRQLACEWQFFLPREWVWRLDLHIGILTYVATLVGQYRITYRRSWSLTKLPYGGVLGPLG